MTIGELVSRLPEARLHGDPELTVTGISHDSRRIEAGWIFAALPGQRAHGLEFVDEAIAKGAVAVLTDRTPSNGETTTWISSPNPRPAMAAAAWSLAGNPQDDLLMIGITGTNGKSTTAHLLSLILDTAGRPCAFLGTLGYFLAGGGELTAERTTPEAPDLAQLLLRTLEAGGQAVAMEVSSHALMQDRLAGLRFTVAVWTNLSRDHLDYHGDMESYFMAKRRLFTDHLAVDGRRVLPVDDPWAERLMEDRREGDVTWGLSDGVVHADDVQADLDGLRFELSVADVSHAVRLPLIGEHNLRNALAAAAAAHAAGVADEAICGGLERAHPLPGRLESIAVDLPFPVLVDYAHSPGGLRTVLHALRRVTDRRLIVVFGAGGDRDTGKRGPMGSAVGELADVAVVTSDNPRSEDPTAIAGAVADGVRSAGGEPVIVLDRKEAIAHALEIADEHALVVVAGKGHEATQTIGDTQVPFSDQQVIQELAGRIRCE